MIGTPGSCSSCLLLVWLTYLTLVSKVAAGFAQPNSSPKKSWQRIPILQYHDEWVCVNKPTGLTVHRSRTTPKSSPVLTTTVKRQLARKVFPVHRLDHRTSGVMLLSFNSEMAATLHDQAIRKGTKKYIALVRGVWSHEQEIIVDRPVKINEITKSARTKFSCLATLDGDNERSSPVLCEPLSGRAHQIRRHAHSIGHPIIGDTEHGDSKVNRWWREEKNLNRLALHGWSIEFSLNGNHHACMAPLPAPFRALLQATCLWASALEKIPRLSVEPYDNHGGSFGRNFKKQDQ